MIVATAMLARERARTTNGQVPVLRIKFGVVLAIVRSMWFALGPIADLLITEQQQEQVVKRGQALMRGSLTRPVARAPIRVRYGGPRAVGLSASRHHDLYHAGRNPLVTPLQRTS